MRKSLWLLALLLLSVALVPARAWGEEKDEGKEGKEEKVKWDQVPAAVQKTLTAEARGQTIETVDKEERDGKVVYEADVKLDGKNYEILVDPDGTLIAKKLDQEDEKKGKDEKDEKK
jgi:hypothetical protein